MNKIRHGLAEIFNANRKIIIGVFIVFSVSFLALFKPSHIDWVTFVGSLGPVMISCMVGYVAYMQYKIEQYKKQTMFYVEKMQALEDLYSLVIDSFSLTEDELIESETGLGQSKRGVILQRFYILHIRFKTLFNISDVYTIRNVWEEKNMLRFQNIAYRKNPDYIEKALETSILSNEKSKKIEMLHKKIEDEVLSVIGI